MLILGKEKELQLIKDELQHHTQSGGKLEVQIIPEDENSQDLPDYEATTLLHLAAKYGNVEATQYLINTGYDLNVTNSSGSTPLMIATHFERVEVFEMLLNANVDIFLCNNSGLNVAKLALQKPRSLLCCNFLEKIRSMCKNDSQAIAMKLLEIDCPLKTSTILDDVSIVRYMLDNGRAVDEPDPNDFNRTALHYGVLLENQDIVNLLLDRGIDVNVVDDHGKTPLFFYDPNSKDTRVKLEILKIMLYRGASLSILDDENGVTLLQFLCTLGKRDTVEILLEYNKSLLAEGKNGLPLLEALVGNKNSEVIDVLQREKWNDSTFDQAKALLLATVRGNSKILELMLRKGVDPNSTVQGYTILVMLSMKSPSERRKISMADDKDYFKCIELLLYHGADAQFIHNKVVTFFDICLKSKNFALAKIALAHLALMEELGHPIKELIMIKINMDLGFEKYFHQCKRRLEKMKKTAIYRQITIFKFLTVNERKIVCYARNQDLILKLKFILNHKRNSKMYYDNVLRRRLAYSLKMAKLEDNAVAVLFEITELQQNELVVHMIVDYLDYFDLLNFS